MVRIKRKKLTQEQKEQIAQRREVRRILSNIGFSRIPGIEGKHFIYDGRQTEMDDVFFLENVMVIMEYTIGKGYKDHLAKKSFFYRKVLNDTDAFISFILEQDQFSFLKHIMIFLKSIIPRLSLLVIRVKARYNCE